LSAWLFAGLLLWGTGVLCQETLATLGIVFVALGGAVDLARRGVKPAWTAGRGYWPLWLFVTLALVMPLLSGFWPTATGLGRLSDWVMIPIGAWALGTVSPRRRATLAITCAAVFLVSCTVAGFQHFGFWPNEAFFAPLAWTRLPFYRVYETVPGAPERFMGGGLIFHRLKFAHVGGIAVLAACGLGLRPSGRARALGLATAAFGFAAVFLFPYARAATAALAGGLLVTVALSLRNRRWGLSLGGGVLAIALLIVAADGPLRARFVSGLTASGSGDRNLLLESGVSAVLAHPLTGVGLGRFRPSLFAPPGSPAHVLAQPGKAHNEFLSMAAETGLIGALAFVFLLLWLFRRMKPAEPFGPTALGVLTYFVLLSQVHDPLFQAPFSMALALGLCAGLTPRSGPSQTSTPSTRATPPSPPNTPGEAVDASPANVPPSKSSETQPSRNAPAR
jgi:O-antigen ligase